MRNILPFFILFALYFGVPAAFSQTAPAPSTACVFVSIDTVKRDDIKTYAESQKDFESAAKKAPGCLRALFMQNVFYKDKFIKYAEFATPAAAKEFAKAQSELKTPAKSEVSIYEVVKNSSNDTPLIIAVDLDEVPTAFIPEFLKISKPLRDGTNTERDTLSYELYSSPQNPSKFFLFELYKNRAAHAFHSKQPHFTQWDKKCADLKIGRKGKFLDIAAKSK